MTFFVLKGSKKDSVIWILTLICLCALSLPAMAQETLKFESIKEQRIRVADLPNAVESVIPSQLSRRAALPRLPKFETLKKTQKTVFPNIVEILAIQKPIGSLQRHGTLVRGHGVWVQHGNDVHLVTAGHWVESAVSIFLDTEARPDDYNPLHAKKESFEKRKYDRDPMRIIKKEPDRFLKLTVTFNDKNRNVAVLSAENIVKPKGLVFFDIENELASRIYGLSPYLGDVLVESLVFPPGEKELYIGYYLQTNFLGILGAPLVSSTGKLIAITAYPHPTKKQTSLLIPPVALRVALEKANKTPDDQKTKK